jgi:hypothetical protein
MNILKRPYFENDDYLLRINVSDIPADDIVKQRLENISTTLLKYYEKKSQAFASKDVNPNVFSEFAVDRPSLNSLSSLDSLDSTIYTVACEKQNGVPHDKLVQLIKEHLESKPGTRRCMVRMANSFMEYRDSELSAPSDVTCLNLIHYFGDKPRLVFRASDATNELLVDILTVIDFFIKPVYGDKSIELSIYASTCQNYSGFENFINQYKMIVEPLR